MSTVEEAVLIALEKTKKNIGGFETKFQILPSSAELPLSETKLHFFKKCLMELRYSLVELEALSIGDTNIVSKDMLKLAKRYLSKVADMEIEEEVTYGDLANLASSLFEELNTNLYVMEKEDVEVKPWVLENTIPPIPSKLMETVAKNFHSTRKDGVSIFDFKMGSGENLLAFHDYMKAERVYSYGTDVNAEKCQTAKNNGVFKVAKEGIRMMSNNTFDIAMFFMEDFTFVSDDYYQYRKQKEEVEFNEFLTRKAVRSGGYIIFNLPYYRIPDFAKRINNQLRVEEIYRIDEESGNLLFITTFRKADYVSQNKKLRTAFLNPKKLEHYEDMEMKFLVDKGELVLPETFRPYVIDQDDHLEAFKDRRDDFDLIQEVFEPRERVVELNRPLQPYKPGHIPAMATIEITSGIYDTSLHKDLVDDFNYPHISSSKIIQQEVQEKEEEMYKGKMVQTVSLKKRNILVFKTLELDGTIREILNTK